MKQTNVRKHTPNTPNDENLKNCYIKLSLYNKNIPMTNMIKIKHGTG